MTAEPSVVSQDALTVPQITQCTNVRGAAGIQPSRAHKENVSSIIYDHRGRTRSSLLDRQPPSPVELKYDSISFACIRLDDCFAKHVHAC